MTENFWEQYEKATQAESGGGGIVAECVIETGYKAYVSGPQEDSWFAVAPGDEDTKKAVKATADAYAQSNGSDRARWGIQIRALRESAYSAGQPATWQGDRFFNTDSWTEACKDVVIPSLKDNGVILPFTGWCRLGFRNDPYKEGQGEAGMTDTDQKGNRRFPQVVYVTEVFASQDAAYAALGVGATPTANAGTATAVPTGWDAETWASVVDDIRASDKAPNALAQEYGVTVADIVRARR